MNITKSSTTEEFTLYLDRRELEYIDECLLETIALRHDEADMREDLNRYKKIHNRISIALDDDPDMGYNIDE